MLGSKHRSGGGRLQKKGQPDPAISLIVQVALCQLHQMTASHALFLAAIGCIA